MANNLYQYSVLNALMQGICKEGTTLPKVLTHGDHAIGTIAHLNGELIIIDGEAYHFPPDGSLRRLSSTDLIPFIMATIFRPTLTKSLSSLTLSSLKSALSPLLPEQQNRFLSVRVKAHFKDITFRVIPAQSKPREGLAALAKRQSLHETRDIAGVLFGFWSPAFATGFSVAGFHMHFLSADRSVGGHVMGFEAVDAEVEAAGIGEYRVELPATGEFNEEVIGDVEEKELNKAEG